MLASSLVSGLEGSSHTVSAPHVKATLLSRDSEVIPSQTLELALRLVADEGWHTYWVNPGDTGLPTRIDWQLPNGFRTGDIEWPIPERVDFQGMTNFGYHGEAWLIVPVAIPANLLQQHASAVDIVAHAKWLVCRDVCIPGEAQLRLQLPVAEQHPVESAQSERHIQFKQATEKLPLLIETAVAEYRVEHDRFELQVELSSLPVLNQKPEALLASKGIVSNGERPLVEIVNDKLVVSANKDPYLEEFPEALSVLLVSGKEDNQTALDVFVRHNPELVMLSSNPTASQSNVTRRQKPLSAETTVATSLLTTLFLALLGGLILNAMPCVFPVLSLKVISLVQSGNHSTAERHQHGLAYTAGVVLSFLLVAGLLIALRSAGEQIGWGFQLQSPWFVGVLVYVLFLLGLSMSGVIEFGSALQNVGQGLTQNTSDWQKSFFTGVLATIVATPCTAPFMGTAMGVALSQPPYIALLIFAVMGLGLALPFLLIAYIPAIAAVLPSPGNWMVRFKEALAFPIYLTVVWLLWVFSRQVGNDATAALLVGMVMLAFAVWLWRTTLYLDKNLWSRLVTAVAVITALAMLVVGMSSARLTENGNKGDVSDWRNFSNEALVRALEEHDTVFVNMTADWCITCKVNERVALATDKVQQVFKARNVAYLKGDWTHSDAVITQYLESFDRNGVPLYVVYKKGEEPRVLPQILSPDLVVDAIN